jgi:hypothetical protein
VLTDARRGRYALSAIISLRNHPHDVNSAVWTRGAVLVASALLTLVLTIRAAS